MDIIFDEKSRMWDVNNFEFNRLFIASEIQYLHDVLRAQGYLYLNGIYESFGVEWNPDDENKLLRWSKDVRHIFDMLCDKKNNRIVIHVDI